jgi:quercetin dioxygenase-like cupin family protein
MHMRGLVLVAAVALAGCVSIDVQDNSSAADVTLAAIENAHVRECPASRVLAGARTEGFGEARGVESVDIALTPLASDPTRMLRLRRLTIAPGGVIPWHDHTVNQGMALMVSGEMVELRNSCLDAMTYRAGDVAREDAGTAHSWRNETTAPAVVLVAHVVAR